MKVTHELLHTARCPLNGLVNLYHVTVETSVILAVEKIKDALAGLPGTAYQEEITTELATKLGCRVTTVGYHSGVKTTCRA